GGVLRAADSDRAFERCAATDDELVHLEFPGFWFLICFKNAAFPVHFGQHRQNVVNVTRCCHLF
ncbi:MAG TPA: hypothetical protein VN670_09815, partial [Acidobacteriaceae bacterium]|nr:hypothetical protein [Acidobacteriaceae bacterium]